MTPEQDKYFKKSATPQAKVGPDKQAIGQLLLKLATVINQIGKDLIDSADGPAPKAFDPQAFFTNLLSVIQALGQIAIQVIPLFVTPKTPRVVEHGLTCRNCGGPCSQVACIMCGDPVIK